MESDMKSIDDPIFEPPPTIPPPQEDSVDGDRQDNVVYVPQYQPVVHQRTDAFENFDKTAYILIFVAFIIGFFMGKTMQPVILRAA